MLTSRLAGDATASLLTREGDFNIKNCKGRHPKMGIGGSRTASSTDQLCSMKTSILTPGQALRQGVKLIECPFGILIANALDYLNPLSPPIRPALSSRDRIISYQIIYGKRRLCLLLDASGGRHSCATSSQRGYLTATTHGYQGGCRVDFIARLFIARLFDSSGFVPRSLCGPVLRQ